MEEGGDRLNYVVLLKIVDASVGSEGVVDGGLVFRNSVCGSRTGRI